VTRTCRPPSRYRAATVSSDEAGLGVDEREPPITEDAGHFEARVAQILAQHRLDRIPRQPDNLTHAVLPAPSVAVVPAVRYGGLLNQDSVRPAARCQMTEVGPCTSHGSVRKTSGDSPTCQAMLRQATTPGAELLFQAAPDLLDLLRP
jgi:hypothetical protein